MPRGSCVTPQFKNTSRLVCGKPDERSVHTGRVAKYADFFFKSILCMQLLLCVDFPGEFVLSGAKYSLTNCCCCPVLN